MRVVIIGNGVAGITAAKLIRRLGQGSEIEVFAEEPWHCYHRPRLPELIAGEVGVGDILTYPEEWYASQNIDVHLATRVRSVEPAALALTLDDGSKVHFDRLLLTSGSRPFLPPIEGIDKDRVFALRTIDDARGIQSAALTSKRAVVVGGGLLGLEAASALTRMGIGVCVLEQSGRLLSRQLDAAAARMLEERVADLGIEFVKNATTVRVDGSGSASGVALDDGREIPGDMVLFSTGVRCATGYLAGSGVEVDGGVVVDRFMRTSAGGIYAAGDVARFGGRSWGIIPVALAQAGVAARAVVGDESKPYKDIAPSNTLKVTGIDVFSAGRVTNLEQPQRELVEVDENAGRYRKVVIEDGRIIGAIVLGSTTGVNDLRSLVTAGADVSRWTDSIASEDFDYSLLKAHS